MAKDSDEAADRPWNGDKAGWIEAEKLFDRKIYDQLGDPGQWYWREKFVREFSWPMTALRRSGQPTSTARISTS